MTTFNWKVNSLTSRIDDGYVSEIHYTIDAVDGEYTSGGYGSVSLSGELSVPYASLTEEVAVGWVQEALGNQVPEETEEGVTRSATDRTAIAVSEVEQALQNQIDVQKTPVTQSGVPWS